MTPIKRATEAAWSEVERQSQEQRCDLRAVRGELDMDGIVRAVIVAIREPSEGMIKAGDNVDSEGGCTYNADRIYPAMIDKMLEEG